jgi:hypothetical protein
VPTNAQSLANRLGKILRISSDGTIPADNPTSFPNIAGSPSGVNRAIWAVGVRNPFTFSFQPGTGRMHINDVGQGTWEEVNVGTAGANFGWPTCEGACATAGMTNPLYQYSSVPVATCAITGGAFYNPTTPTFPAQFIGKYFFADFCAGWIKVLDPLGPPPTDSAVDFTTGISSPVDIQVANDGSLYYLARGSSSVFRVQFVGSTQPTIAINDVSVAEGNSGVTTAGFTVSLSNASSQTVTVNYATANNTASAGDDYINATGTLTFTPGQRSQTLSVGINGDVLNEDTVTFNVNLTAATNATISDGQGIGTIVDDDAPVLATEENSQRAIALDTVVFLRDPFLITNEHYFDVDKRTRVSLFATNIELKQGLVITAQGIDSQQVTHQLQLEFVGGLPTFLGFTQIVVKLPDGIAIAGDLRVTITVRGKTSNVALIGVKP